MLSHKVIRLQRFVSSTFLEKLLNCFSTPGDAVFAGRLVNLPTYLPDDRYTALQGSGPTQLQYNLD